MNVYGIMFLVFMFMCSQFRVCSHPNPDVRQELAEKIGLEERQVKFWFQNRRSQMKASLHLTTVLLYMSSVLALVSISNKFLNVVLLQICSIVIIVKIIHKLRLNVFESVIIISLLI